jgi:hypothetical protein
VTLPVDGALRQYLLELFGTRVRKWPSKILPAKCGSGVRRLRRPVRNTRHLRSPAGPDSLACALPVPSEDAR